MTGTSPDLDPEALARWLLASEAALDAPCEVLTAAAIRVYEQLRAHLAVFFGIQGFDALWTRALHLVRRTTPWQYADALDPPGAHALDAAVYGRTPAEAYTVLLAIFTQFLSLLFTFIGADLGFRLLQQYWPALPAPRARAFGEEGQP